MLTKINRYTVFFAVFILLIFSAVRGEVAAQDIYPDLLDEEVTETEDFLDEKPDIVIYDPLEPMNRVFFQFNDKFYFWVLKPVTNAYMWVLPYEIRDSFGNFFLNLATPIRLLNALLQGDLEKSGVVLKRFVINSTLGVYGFADTADVEFGIDRKRADFGQTLGKWGLGEGIYLCWPIVGSSSVRDSVGLVADAFSHPVPYFSDSTAFNASYFATDRVNNLSFHPDAYEDLKRYSVDAYAASRQAYYEYRKAIIERY
jgi:phospholipid-binding lipoprotein MlaA